MQLAGYEVHDIFVCRTLLDRQRDDRRIGCLPRRCQDTTVLEDPELHDRRHEAGSALQVVFVAYEAYKQFRRTERSRPVRRFSGQTGDLRSTDRGN